MTNGHVIRSKMILSNATPDVTFLKLLPPGALPKAYENKIKAIDYTSPVTKINVALKELPNFLADPHANPSIPAPVVGGPEPIRRLPAPPESAAGTARSIRRTDTTTRAGCRGFRRGANRQRCGAANSTNCPNWTPVAPSSTEDAASARRSHAV